MSKMRSGRSHRSRGVALGVAVVLGLSVVTGLAARAADSPRDVDPARLTLTPAQGVTIGNTPVVITGADLSAATFDQIAPASRFTLALASDGTLYTWGSNDMGQLGNGSTTTRPELTRVDMNGALAGKKVVQITAYGAHAAVLTDEGRVYTWGKNAYGALGNNSTEPYSSVPVPVDTSGVLAGKEIVQIDTSGDHMVALDKDGRVYTWGYDSHGQIGTGSPSSPWIFRVPVRVTALDALTASSPVVMVSAGGSHTVAVTADNKVYSWGMNSFGQLGTGSTSSAETAPVQAVQSYALTGQRITTVEATGFATFVVAGGSAFAWGNNDRGGLGISGPVSSAVTVPTAVDTSGALRGKTLVRVESHYDASIAVDSDGVAYSWGTDSGVFGRLGIGIIDLEVHPPAEIDRSDVLAGKPVSSIGMGGAHGVALDSAGQAYIWGYKNMLGGGRATDSLVPLRLPTHRVVFGSDAYIRTDVVVDVEHGTVATRTPRHPGGEVEVSLESFAD